MYSFQYQINSQNHSISLFLCSREMTLLHEKPRIRQVILMCAFHFFCFLTLHLFKFQRMYSLYCILERTETFYISSVFHPLTRKRKRGVQIGEQEKQPIRKYICRIILKQMRTYYNTNCIISRGGHRALFPDIAYFPVLKKQKYTFCVRSLHSLPRAPSGSSAFFCLMVSYPILIATPCLCLSAVFFLSFTLMLAGNVKWSTERAPLSVRWEESLVLVH
eukprot:GEMP01038796.1.p1 GENE.GEMP01038796.1~~GEMP01038796.1.p1  ORF type:complete len:219 (+),score=-28.16 GEMP01038796.1:106-762(+)